VLVYFSERWQGTYVELVLLSHQCVVQQMSIDLQLVSNSHGADVEHTCGLISTRSMNSTTKSCSTYLSQKRPQFLQTVRRTPWPLDRSSAPEYSV
jgi:hypothetical protein